LEDVAGMLQSTELAQWLRFSRWPYPIVNIVHLLGLAALFGSILALDLRMLGLWRSTDAGQIALVAVPVAATGLAVAVVSGFLLFIVRADEYVAMPVFWIKLAFVAAGTASAVVVRIAGLDRRAPVTAASVSMTCWIAAIGAGRLIGYWE
jgi:hypothetical protein